MQSLDERQQHILQHDPMRYYRSKRDNTKKRVADKYTILGFISSGTYGKVYKAQSKDEDGKLHAIKKFKPDKEGDVVTYTGISQSAIREIALNREISHENVVALNEVILEDKSIYMVFEYAEHDFLQLIHHHSQTLRRPIAHSVLKSLTYQLLNGLLYLHSCHIIHRDLKPANILITSGGVVKIGDLGLARLTNEPLQPLFAGDKVVVTIWYRAPELLLGAKHYNKAVDVWAVGCVVAEMASLRPIFKGEEAKLDTKKNVPFQKDQVIKIFEVLGTPDENEWPSIRHMPEYTSMKRLDYKYPNRLLEWATPRMKSQAGYDFLRELFVYDPDRRLTAKKALHHKWFQEEPKPTRNSFHGLPSHQIPPHRRITHDEALSMVTLPTAPAAAAIQTQVATQFASSQGHQLSQNQHHQHMQTQPQGKGSTASFASSGGGGTGGGPARKKARLA